MQRKVISIILATALLAIAAVTLLLPQLFKLEKIRENLVAEVSSRLESVVAVGSIEWAWLPVPHVVLKDSLFENEKLRLTVPRADVYPNWLAFLRSEIEAGKVVLDGPEITIKQLSFDSDRPFAEVLPVVDVVVRKGTLHAAAGAAWPGVQSRDFSVHSLSAKARVSLSGISFDFSGKPTFGEQFGVTGEIRRDGSFYKMAFDFTKFRLTEVLSSFAHKELTPVESLMNVRGSLEGNGSERIKANLIGDLPCLLAFPADKKILLNCGFVDLDFEKSGSDMLLSVNEFEMKEPGLKISGIIRRSASTDSQSNPIWDIDLKGADLDLTRIRSAVLTMWGDNEVAREVSDIVLSGKAGKAGYTFHGTVADFEDVRSMVITADEIDASIKIPETNLLLENTRGRMVIREGKLHVFGDSAKLGNSMGSNCKLMVGLPEDDFSILLDVDLDADLADLPGVLSDLIDDKMFLTELAKFTNVSGSAIGHLHLGDDLNDLKVTVNVSSMKGTAEYAPLNWEFMVDGGSMTIAPHLVKWEDIKGTYGPHKVHRASGSVAWQDEILFNIDQLDAKVFSPELHLGSLSFWENLDTALRKYITSLDGTFELRETKISGNVNRPESWRAEAGLVFDGLVIETPSLPEPLHIAKGRGRFSDKKIEISDCAGTLFGDPFSLKAALSHEQLEQLEGRISLQGRVGERFGAWIREQGLIAKSFFPRLPMEVTALDLDLKKSATAVNGVIGPGEPGRSLPRVEFSVQTDADDPLQVSVKIFGENEEVLIGIDFLDNIEETFLFSWKGMLSGKTVGQLFEEKSLLEGSIAGDFQLYLPQDPNKVAFTGELAAENLRWYFANDSGRSLAIKDLRLAGVEKNLRIENLLCALSDRETIKASGLLSREGNGFKMDLDLGSEFLSRQTLEKLLEDIKGIRDKNPLTGKKRKKGEKAWNLTGTVNFDLVEFDSGKPAAAKSQPTLVWRPLKGEIRLYPEWKFAAAISSGRLCCLEATGEWYSVPELGKSYFQMQTANCLTAARFERVLPCLGYPQDLIEGEFDLDALLVGRFDNWQEGYLNVTSKGGRILRMKLLSMIFSVVNITDLFTLSPQDDGSSSTAGFPYSELVLKTHIQDNELIIDEAVVRGEGLNLFTKGKMNLASFDMDFVVMISPFKTLDAIVSKIPLVGRVIGGKTATVVTIPVSVTGSMRAPKVTLLPPSEVGEGIINVVKRAIMLPFSILSPMVPDVAPDRGGRQEK